jgi:hypothetical protein
MTDRELLELAAKAAEMKDGTWFDGWNDEGRDSGDLWNPLDDDGAALRLAVKLKLELGFPRKAIVWSFGRKGEVCSENYSKDPYAATRRAIVRAAAEIGKEMK